MQKTIDPAADRERAASASTDAESVTHTLSAAWGGVPGECGAECACGVTFDGFDTIAEATALIDEHVADNIVTHPAWCAPKWCWAYGAAEDEPEEGGEKRPGGFHESAWVDVSTLGNHTIGLQLQQDHGRPEEAPAIAMTTGQQSNAPVLYFSLEQAAQLRDALDLLLPPKRRDRRPKFERRLSLYNAGYTSGVAKALDDLKMVRDFATLLLERDQDLFTAEMYREAIEKRSTEL